MKEKVLQALNELGFKLEEVKEIGYEFEYEDSTYLYMPQDDDEDFLSISIPCIFDCTPEKADFANLLKEKINAAVKYVKTYEYGNKLWLFYEHEYFEGEDLMTVLSHMIQHLDMALKFIYKTCSAIKAEEENEAVEVEEIDTEDSNSDNN